jgi:hypothetical protein
MPRPKTKAKAKPSATRGASRAMPHLSAVGPAKADAPCAMPSAPCMTRKERIQDLHSLGVIKAIKGLYNYEEVMDSLTCSARKLRRWIGKNYLVKGPGRTITAESFFDALLGKEFP